MTQTNTVEEVLPGVWLIRFPDLELVRAEHCTHLVPPLIQGSVARPIVLLAHPPPELRVVHGDMIPYWIEVFTRRGVQVRAIGVVTTRITVRGVLNGLGLALRVSGKAVTTTTASTVAELLEWAKNQ